MMVPAMDANRAAKNAPGGVTDGGRTLVRAGWVIPVAAAPIENGAVLVEGDRIIAVDRAEAFEGTPGISRELGNAQAWLLPGFVNSHYHSGRSFQLGYSDEPGDIGLVRTFSFAGFTDLETAREFAYLDTLNSACQLMRSGVTTTLDMAWGGRKSGVGHEYAISAYRDLGLAVIFAPIARDRGALVYGEDEDFLATLPEDLATRVRAARLGQSGKITAAEYQVEWQDLHDRFDDGDLIRLIAALDGVIWSSDGLTKAIGQWAAAHRIPIHLHHAESKLEVDWALATLGRTTTAHLSALGVLTPLTSLAHGIWVSDEDMRLCAEAGVSIAHTPTSDLRWYAGIAPVVDWLKAGVNVCLGIDADGFSDANDFLQEMRVASLLQRVPGLLDWPGLSPETVLRTGTLNGARCFGLDGRVGTLEPGKRADLVLIAGDQVRGRLVNPLAEVQEVLVRRARAEHVQCVMVGGRVVLKDGSVVNVNEKQIVEKTRRLYDELWANQDEARAQLINELIVYVHRYFKLWQVNSLPTRYRYNGS